MSDTKIDLEDDAVKAAILAAAETKAEAMVGERAKTLATTMAREIADEENAGLLKKRDEILSEKKKLKGELDGIREKYNFEEIDAERAAAKAAKLEAMSDTERLQTEMTSMQTKFSTLEDDSVLRQAAMQDEFNTKVLDYEADLAKHKKLLNNQIKTTDITKAVSVNNGISYLLEPMLERDIQVVQDGDQYVTRVMENGEVKLNSEGKPMTVAQRVAEYKEDEKFGMCFHASKANGGGAEGGDNNFQEPKAGLKRSEMSIKQKSAYVGEHGEAKFLALPR